MPKGEKKTNGSGKCEFKPLGPDGKIELSCEEELAYILFAMKMSRKIIGI